MRRIVIFASMISICVFFFVEETAQAQCEICDRDKRNCQRNLNTVTRERNYWSGQARDNKTEADSQRARAVVAETERDQQRTRAEMAETARDQQKARAVTAETARDQQKARADAAETARDQQKSRADTAEVTRDQQRTRADNAEARVTQLTGSVDTLRSQFTSERNKRQSMANDIPLIFTKIQLRNEANNTAIGSYSDIFNKAEVRNVMWHATIRNPLSGVSNLSGDLYVKYIKPDGSVWTISSSPAGYSSKRSILIAESETVVSGWGNSTVSVYDAGVYIIQFWWNSRLITEKSFIVR